MQVKVCQFKARQTYTYAHPRVMFARIYLVLLVFELLELIVFSAALGAHIVRQCGPYSRPAHRHNNTLLCYSVLHVTYYAVCYNTYYSSVLLYLTYSVVILR
jgi:hypothetical protein